MQERTMICIGCPMGCRMTVILSEAGVESVTGNTCKRGESYARKEVTNPTRIVTSTVRVSGGTLPVISVKTNSDIPKGKIRDCIKVLKMTEAKAPVRIGDIVVSDVVGTGVDIVATKGVDAIPAR